MAGLAADESDMAAVRTARSVLFNPDNYRPYPSTRQLLFGLGELMMGSFSVNGYNANRISITLDTLPNDTLRLLVCDNGRAHDDTMESCYDNGTSLISEKRSVAHDPAADGISAESGTQQDRAFSRNGTGCGTALKRMADDIQHLIGSHLIIRHGRTVEQEVLQRQAGKKNIKAEVIMATFDLKWYLSDGWQNTDLPLLKFVEQMRRIEHLKKYETAVAFNLLSLIPLEETVEAALPDNLKQANMDYNRHKQGVVPLQCQSEEVLWQHIQQHERVRNGNTGFSTALFNPHGLWESCPDDEDIAFSATDTPDDKISMRKVFETGFWQPIFNFDELFAMSGKMDGPAVLEKLLSMKRSVPGRNVKVKINKSDSFSIGQPLEILLASCLRDKSRCATFLHRAADDDAVVIGAWPKSMDFVAKALPPDLLCDKGLQGVPKEFRDSKGPAPSIHDRCGVLVFHMAHNKVMRVTMHRTDASYFRNNTPLSNLSKCLKQLRKSGKAHSISQGLINKMPLAFRGMLEEKDKERLCLLAEPECKEVAKKVLFDCKVPLCLFIFAKHTLLDDSKTNYREFDQDIELRILPEALRAYFGPIIDQKGADVAARKENEKQEKLLKQQQQRDQMPSTPCVSIPLRRSASLRWSSRASSSLSQEEANTSESNKKRPMPSRYSPDPESMPKKKKKIPHPIFKGIKVPSRVRDTHAIIGSLLRARKPPKASSNADVMQVGTWVAVEFKDEDEDGVVNDKPMHWVGLVHQKMRAKATMPGDWYRVYFTGIAWDHKCKVHFDEDEIRIQEVDMVPGTFQILDSDPLAAH